MTTSAEQYRALVKKLEAIQEAGYMAAPAAEQPAAEPTVAPNSGSSYTGSVGSATNDPVQIPTIEAATFAQAYAQAAKQGLTKFKWCGTYAVKAKPRPVNPQPATKNDYWGQGNSKGNVTVGGSVLGPQQTADAPAGSMG